MIDLFSSIPLRAEGVTGSYVQAQIQIHAKDLFTGFFHLGGDEQFVLFLLEGRRIALYHLKDAYWESVRPEAWNDTLALASGNFRVLPLPEDGLRVYRLLLEADFSGSRTIPAVRGSELISYLGKWQRGEKAGLVLLRQGDSTVVMLLPANSTAVTEGVLVSNSELQTGPGVMTQVRTWGERPFQITLCTHNARSEGWTEYNLRVSFSQFIQRALKRYEELAGRFLVSDLDERVNLESRSQGWAISLFGSNLSVREYFQTADLAASAYIALLIVMHQQMNVVVGKKVAESILSTAAIQLKGEARRLLIDYILSRTSLNKIMLVEEASI